ncbi:lytic transglycosylase, partial [Acinetobacter baumannii]|nr:lytic transglycosylase [Acinetobacter baumannii]
GQALAKAQTMGLNLSLAQLNQNQANPLNYLWSAPKTNDVDYAYLIFALGRLANNDLGNAFANVQRVAKGTPE